MITITTVKSTFKNGIGISNGIGTFKNGIHFPTRVSCGKNDMIRDLIPLLLSQKVNYVLTLKS